MSSCHLVRSFSSEYSPSIYIRTNHSGRIEISAQNHNFAVDPDTLPPGVEVTHVNLNDGTCAGMFYKEKNAMTIQYHPESSPGPHDADICFEQASLTI